ncbi:MAG TPA: hypothetical protein VF316_01745, partial [Polyangiaceae bacterium]
MLRRVLLLCGLLGCSAADGPALGTPADPVTGDDAAVVVDDGGTPPVDAAEVPPVDAAPPKPTRAIQILVEPDGQSGKQLVTAISSAKKSVHM